MAARMALISSCLLCPVYALLSLSPGGTAPNHTSSFSVSCVLGQNLSESWVNSHPFPSLPFALALHFPPLCDPSLAPLLLLLPQCLAFPKPTCTSYSKALILFICLSNSFYHLFIHPLTLAMLLVPQDLPETLLSLSLGWSIPSCPFISPHYISPIKNTDNPKRKEVSISCPSEHPLLNRKHWPWKKKVLISIRQEFVFVETLWKMVMGRWWFLIATMTMLKKRNWKTHTEWKWRK